jgi:hypothetical protein
MFLPRRRVVQDLLQVARAVILEPTSSEDLETAIEPNPGALVCDRRRSGARIL